jgi:hypothetical protein
MEPLLHFKISTSNSFLTLLNNGLPYSTSLGKSDLRLISRSNGEHVNKTGAESVSLGILNGSNGERSLVLLNVHELPNTPSVVTLGDEYHGSKIKLDNVTHLSSSNVYLDGIVCLDIGVRIANGTSIMCHSNRNLVVGGKGLDNLAELVGSLLFGNTVKNKTSLHVKKETEEISRLLKLNHIHETSGEVVVGTNLSVHLDTSLHANLHTLLVGKSVLEAITQDNGKGDTLALLVRTSRGLGGPYSSHLSESPMLGSIETLKVLLVSARPKMTFKQETDDRQTKERKTESCE